MLTLLLIRPFFGFCGHCHSKRPINTSFIYLFLVSSPSKDTTTTLGKSILNRCGEVVHDIDIDGTVGVEEGGRQ